MFDCLESMKQRSLWRSSRVQPHLLRFVSDSVDSIFSMVSIFFSFVNEAYIYMIMSLKQRKRKRFKDKIEPQQIKPDKLSS